MKDSKGRLEIKTQHGVYVYDHIWNQNKPESNLDSTFQIFFIAFYIIDI